MDEYKTTICLGNRDVDNLLNNQSASNRRPYEDIFGKMRDLTNEEYEESRKSLDDISEFIGVNFFDLC